jgi:hypothetical protein
LIAEEIRACPIARKRKRGSSGIAKGIGFADEIDVAEGKGI